jgi:hypothetical protein
MAGDDTQLGGLNSKLFLAVAVPLPRRLMVFHTVSTKSPLEQVDDAAMLELPRLHFEQIVRESEEPESGGTQRAERCGDLSMRPATVSAAEYIMKLANHSRIAPRSPKIRWKVGSIVSRSRASH